jgi:hypothetical protein
VQVVKQRTEGTLTIERRMVQGTQEMVERLIKATQNRTGMINTAFIERLNATFRQRLNNLVRRMHTRNSFKVPPTSWKPPIQRGRPSLAMLQLPQTWAQ